MRISPTAPNSYHIHGRGVDIYGKGDKGWTEAQFRELYNIALETSPSEIYGYNHYRDHHLHVAW